MKAFEQHDRVNFVDENNVFVGYELETICCECASWYISDSPKYDGDAYRQAKYDLEDYCFANSEHPTYIGDENEEDLNGVAFRLIADGKPDLYLILSNLQNGYYDHNFTVKVDEKIVLESSL
jgi:hypothetical protein